LFLVPGDKYDRLIVIFVMISPVTLALSYHIAFPDHNVQGIPGIYYDVVNI